MSRFVTQEAADVATKLLTQHIADHLFNEHGYEVEDVHDNGTAPEYGGGFQFTATIAGEAFHIEVISPYVEDDAGLEADRKFLRKFGGEE